MQAREQECFKKEAENARADTKPQKQLLSSMPRKMKLLGETVAYGHYFFPMVPTS